MSKWAHRLQRLSFQTVGVLSMSIQTNQYQSSIFREDFRKVKRKFHEKKIFYTMHYMTKISEFLANDHGNKLQK